MTLSLTAAPPPPLPRGLGGPCRTWSIWRLFWVRFDFVFTGGRGRGCPRFRPLAAAGGGAVVAAAAGCAPPPSCSGAWGGPVVPSRSGRYVGGHLDFVVFHLLGTAGD